ncbi:TIGR01777 family oxidoreductase [Pseudodesulfovibrio sp. zrk46]|uniref:TIGR01777 family oxidoreductase n=1 Tax=Pseudodesulfovibrio sp. zrk46 TaxID=2725288 RepID=UPI00144969D9|nr:TIGR01777 family oxidoreductase [Pseudodesulfovibrio sp. zrk46]QJB55905.1 TIGR01777 family protein [Pseudodesulfovibrio sp. zrk46]
MRAIIAGGTGFIGKALVAELKANDWEIVVLSRSPGKVAEVFGSGVIGMRWDNGDWPDMLGADSVIVNLAGENIAAGRWTATRKKRILESRVKAGEQLVKAVKLGDTLPAAIIQGSAVGYYGPHGNNPIDEDTPSGTGYLAEVARQWEDSTKELEAMGVRRAIIRTGMVLGNGGALERLLPPFRFFVGGPPGDGFQGVSWIHIDDEVGAIRFLMENDSTSGAYNLTAPTPVRFRKFAHILGDTLNRPYKLRVPAAIMRLLLGEMADEVILSGQLALPKRLEEAGYQFKYPSLEGALGNLLG